MPIWATQGRRFDDHKHLLNSIHTTNEQAEKFLEEEAQTVDNRYRPRSHMDASQINVWVMSNENIASDHWPLPRFWHDEF